MQDYPPVRRRPDASKINPDQAREKAKRLFAKITLGLDPQSEKEQAKIEAAKPTFSQVVDQYLKAKATELRASSLKSLTLYLRGSAYFPTLHRMPMHKITRDDVALHLDRINDESGAPTASRARAHISALYSWAIHRPFGITANVVLNTEEPKASKARDRVLSADELRSVWLACGDDDFGRIVRLLILTGCRRQEVGSMRWSELDLDKGIWTIPSERAKNGREHRLSLPPLALQIIQQVEKVDGRDHLFGKRSSGFVTWGHSKAAFKVELETAWTLHDLRRTAATGMAEIGIEPHIVEAVLNHASGHKAGVAGRYNHAEYKVPMRNALAMWADHVRAVVTGSDRKVVSIRPEAA